MNLVSASFWARCRVCRTPATVCDVDANTEGLLYDYYCDAHRPDRAAATEAQSDAVEDFRRAVRMALAGAASTARYSMFDPCVWDDLATPVANNLLQTFTVTRRIK